MTIAAHASAKTKASGTGGLFKAGANTSLAAGQLVTAAAAKASGVVDGASSAKTKATIGEAAQPFAAQGQAVALASGAPTLASTNAVLVANPNIFTGFGPAPTFFAIDEFGGAYAKSGGTTSQTITDTIDLTVDLTQLATRGTLVAGFYNATALGTGFASLTFTLTGDGATLISQTFTTLAAANAFFTDHAVSLGSLATGALSGATLTLAATFTLTTSTAGQGFYAQMIIGDPPAATTGSQMFVQAMAGMGASAVGSAPPSPHVSPFQPMLAPSRLAAPS